MMVTHNSHTKSVRQDSHTQSCCRRHYRNDKMRTFGCAHNTHSTHIHTRYTKILITGCKRSDLFSSSWVHTKSSCGMRSESALGVRTPTELKWAYNSWFLLFYCVWKVIKNVHKLIHRSYTAWPTKATKSSTETKSELFRTLWDAIVDFIAVDLPIARLYRDVSLRFIHDFDGWVW